MDDNMMKQVAISAAIIHNSHISDPSIFDDDYPPYPTWYDYFLNEDFTMKRLGMDVIERVRNLINNNKNLITEIDKYTSFVHSDFRPANMMIDDNNDVWIVDWEFSGYGHSLADIGQFFRYQECFEPDQLELFEQIYNQESNRSLPKDWYRLCKIRDLVNPLQMLGAQEKCPEKQKDLKNLVIDILNQFGY